MDNNKNLQNNLFLKQFNESNAIAYNKDFVANGSDYNFQLLDNAYRNVGKIYAKLKIAVETNKCESDYCSVELAQIKQLEEAPQNSLDFLTSLMAELSVTEEPNYDPNNNYSFTAANSLMSGKPGFSKTDGYNAYLDLLPDGSQQIVFTGPAFKTIQQDPFTFETFEIENPLIINNSSLISLLESDTSLVVSTPDINKAMLLLLPETGLFMQEMINENKELKATAKISEEFVMKNADGSFDYEIIDLGNNQGKNVLRYDMEKIEKKVTPFINAEVAGLMSSELDLPLQQDKKVLFEIKYKEYFMNNYLKQFTKNQTPTVKEDAAVFDLEEAQKAKAQKFLNDNDLN